MPDVPAAGTALDELVAERLFGLDLTVRPKHDWVRTCEGEHQAICWMCARCGDTSIGPAPMADAKPWPCEPTLPPYSRFLPCTWDVVKKLADLDYSIIMVEGTADAIVSVTFMRGLGEGSLSADGATFPEAVCRAALLACPGPVVGAD